MPVIDLKKATIHIIDGVDNEIEIRIGEGNLIWKETRNRQYILDRGRLYAVRESDETAIDVSFAFTWDWLRSDDSVTIEEALKQVGAAEHWVTSGSDICEPYAVDIQIENNNGCDEILDERITLSEFRYESLDHDLKAGTVSVNGKCNRVAPTVVRIELSLWDVFSWSEWDVFSWEGWDEL